jgi:HD-GYP domain-containing protein (c-di-GMP phosphodiesterase class II)
MLAVTGYVMGTLYERKQAMTNDIRESFSGLLVVLQHFLHNERYTQGENQRVMEMTTSIAQVMGMGSDRIELLRSAILLRDLSLLGISHDMLYKAADVTRQEIVAGFRKNRKQDPRAQAMGGSLRRVIPVIVAEQILEEQGARAVNVPIEAHILAVSDMYLRLTTAKQGKAVSPDEAQSMIAAASGEKFQSGVVDAFLKVCNQSAHAVGAGA